MASLKLSENLTRLRKEKKITQEQLADFLGVTKASVSKWENGQCMPDIMLLPQLAAYFDVSVDELLGYEPQLSAQQIQRLYADYCTAFSERPFDEVLGELRALTRQYYSCYPLLLQISVLYLNHCAMSPEPQQTLALLEEARGLCEHIIENSRSVRLCSDAISLRALFDLQLGRPQAAIEALEESCDPTRISGQNDAVLIQAYQMLGEGESAADFAQISIYLHLLSMVGVSVQYLSLATTDRAACEETVKRIDALAEAYRLRSLHPNVMAQFFYQSALSCVRFGENEKALERLECYAETVSYIMMNENCALHADSYFTRLDKWIERLALGGNPPRDKSFVAKSAMDSMKNPALAALADSERFKLITTKLEQLEGR